jgi:steroid delta-isomerase-like uncharacterized protein
MAAQENNLDLAKKLIDAFNKNDANNLNHFDAYLDANVKYHDLSHGGKTKNLQAFKQAEQEYVKAFPNKKTKIDEIFAADNNKVVVRWTTSGTHKSTFHGVAPTNKDFKISGITVWRFANNKLVEAWQVWDRIGLLEQLGAFHPAHTR